MPLFKIHVVAKLHRCSKCGAGHNNLLTHVCVVSFHALAPAPANRKRRKKGR